MTTYNRIAQEMNLKPGQIESVKALFDEGCTIPFISRYRKERTGGLDEVALIEIREKLNALMEFHKRKEAIVKSLKENDHLTPELMKKIEEAETLARLEDIYLPYKPKRKTRGSVAREKGLEPLALDIMKGNSPHPETFVNEGKGVKSSEEALQGAMDIAAEIINEDSVVRGQLRNLFNRGASLTCKVNKKKKEEAEKYRDYFEYSEPLNRAPSHRVLAVLRGASEGFLNFHMLPDGDEAVDVIERRYIKGKNREILHDICTDSYKRLLSSSLETETRNRVKKEADTRAIDVFAGNLKELLLASPLGQKSVMALDPGIRTGCKLVCLNAQGKLLYNTVIYPMPHQNREEESRRIVKDLVKKFSVEAIAVGNGTGGREAEAFLKGLELSAPVIMVNEAGASVYSASQAARDEFPDYDVTVRGAVSIGRRLMDPLAELVKIDPKSIGVGQYQHDVDQKALKEALNDVVVSCVNSVGVEVNTASKELLSYVAGLNSKTAQNIIDYRNEKGAFKSRNEIKKVKGIGAKAYEQAAGFLRVPDSANPLDASGVHPERYSLVETMAKENSCSVLDLIKDPSKRKGIKIRDYVTQEVGLPTLQDIMDELAKPGRDPRAPFEVFQFDDSVQEISDLVEGMTLPGIITNVTAFGAFVDVGVHQDGLVHISQLSDSFVKDPADVVKTGQKVQVRVLEVDKKRKRISLSMKSY